jgi:hypothetical protein
MGIMPQDAITFHAQSDLRLRSPPTDSYLLRVLQAFGKKVYVLKMADTFATCLPLSLLPWQKFLSEIALMATALLLSTLMISILSLISTPDVPLMLCWTISLNFLHEAIFKRKNIYWIWAGIFTGLSFDSKYTALFLIIGLIGFLLIIKPFRKLIISGWFFLYCFVSRLQLCQWSFGMHEMDFIIQISI